MAESPPTGGLSAFNGKISRVDEQGKRVSWVELYLDLVFVLAVGQLAHLIVAEPKASSVWIALGLFFALWWTWVDFAVLYNRHGSDTERLRLLFLAGSVPIGVAAVAIEPVSTGDAAVFAASLGITRLILAAAHVAGSGDAKLRERVTRACLTAAALFLLSIAVGEPFRYVMWAIAIGLESSAMLTDDREASRRARRERSFAALKPADPAQALDPHHFAERFGLFLIILLGEVLVEAGQASVSGHDVSTAAWAALVAAMLLAAALWWVYFDSAAEVNLKVFELSGGSPAMAKTIFAVGHMLPAFSLLLIAAGIGLLLEEEPPDSAYWLPCIGIGIYLLGTRAFMFASKRVSGFLRALVVIATFQLGRLHEQLSPHAYVWLLAVWVVVCAALTKHADVSRFMGDQAARDSQPAIGPGTSTPGS
jgi:low temperature requirement protein LtrA